MSFAALVENKAEIKVKSTKTCALDWNAYQSVIKIAWLTENWIRKLLFSLLVFVQKKMETKEKVLIVNCNMPR